MHHGMLGNTPPEQESQDYKELYSLSSRRTSNYMGSKYRLTSSFDDAFDADDSFLRAELAARSCRPAELVVPDAGGAGQNESLHGDDDDDQYGGVYGVNAKRRRYGDSRPQLMDVNNSRGTVGLLGGGLESWEAPAMKQDLGVGPKWKGGVNVSHTRPRAGELLLSPRSAVAVDILRSFKAGGMYTVGRSGRDEPPAPAGAAGSHQPVGKEEMGAACHAGSAAQAGCHAGGADGGSRFGHGAADYGYDAVGNTGAASARGGYHMPTYQRSQTAAPRAAAAAVQHVDYNQHAAAAGAGRPGYTKPQAVLGMAAGAAAGSEAAAELLAVGGGARSSSRLQKCGRMDWSVLRSL
jgi:hypothetical protein